MVVFDLIKAMILLGANTEKAVKFSNRLILIHIKICTNTNVKGHHGTNVIND